MIELNCIVIFITFMGITGYINTYHKKDSKLKITHELSKHGQLSKMIKAY